MKAISITVCVGILLMGCGGGPGAAVAPAATIARPATVISSAGYRPIQAGDVVEGATIDYQYFLPSLDQPVVVLAFGQNLIQLVTVKPELSDGLVAFIREIIKEPQNVLAYDEATPTQTEPKSLSWDANKPMEIVFIPIVEGTRFWSVTEGNSGEVQAAYKIVRRKDGGLRFIDAYGFVALQSANYMFTLNGGGTGLVFSSRLALLKPILSNPNYQRGANVFAASPPDPSQYDPRILLLDPSRTGLAQDRDWVLLSRPGPNPGLQGP